VVTDLARVIRAYGVYDYRCGGRTPETRAARYAMTFRLGCLWWRAQCAVNDLAVPTAAYHGSCRLATQAATYSLTPRAAACNRKRLLALQSRWRLLLATFRHSPRRAAAGGHLTTRMNATRVGARQPLWATHATCPPAFAT